jgi:DNA-binding NarL/FixJ family response regulator
VTHTLGILTDISHFDATEKPMVRALGPTAQYFSDSWAEINSIRTSFSAREVEILNLLAISMTSRSIANSLNLSHHTIDTHRRNMLHKLEAANTLEMIYLAREFNLI